jgi:sphingomyelin phosphodiesterase acid-like 3
MAPTAIGCCSARPFGKRSKHYRTLPLSYFQAIFLRTIFAASSTPLRRTIRRRRTGSSCIKRCSFWRCNSSGRSPIQRSFLHWGNDDSYCGNYQLQPQGQFLADTLAILRALVGALASLGFDRNWMSYGNYSVTVPGLRMIFPNTVFFSANYHNGCGSAADADPGSATLAWLETELAAAERAQQRVWLVYHIPPGVDGFTTLRRGSCPDAIIPMWRQTYAEAFYALTRRYSDTIVASFAGHIHMDDFRLLGGDNGYYGFVLITPALSPIYGQNPAFRTVTSDCRRRNSRSDDL